MSIHSRDDIGRGGREVRVDSFAALNEALYAESWQAELGRFRSNLAFRGACSVRHGLTTTLTRLSGKAGELENHLLRNFRKYASGARLPDTPWAWLALGQHHGLPTRLLDWTFSPQVALHFATQDLPREDAAVWCVDYVRAKALLPPRLRAILEEESANVFTLELLGRGAGSLSALDALAPEPFAVFLEPPSFDERIVNQYALFSMLSDPTASFGTFLDAHPELWRRIVIPAELKAEVRDKLDQANVTERVLFPGLDGLCRWLARHYAPGRKVSDCAAEGAITTSPSNGARLRAFEERPMASRLSKVTTDHDEIRRWAEERGGRPAAVASTEGQRGEGDPGIIRLDFPGYSGEGSLEEISWEDWFRKFDESNLALVYEDVTSGGERSNFNKLVGRETAKAREQGVRTNRRALRSGGRGTSRGGTRKATSRGGTRKTGTSSRAKSTSRGGTRKAGTSARKSTSSRAKTGTARATAKKPAAKATRRGGAKTGSVRARSGVSAKSSTAKRSTAKRGSTAKRSTSSRGGASKGRSTSGRGRSTSKR